MLFQGSIFSNEWLGLVNNWYLIDSSIVSLERLWLNRPRTVQNQNYYKRAIVNDGKRKSSRIHLLCDDVVFFRLRSKLLSPVCTGAAFPLFYRIQSEWKPVQRKPQNVEQNKSSHKREQNDLASFLCPLDTVTKTWPKDQFAVFRKMSIPRGCRQAERILGCVLSFLENPISSFYQLRPNVYLVYVFYSLELQYRVEGFSDIV